jgi:hypothetical protein
MDAAQTKAFIDEHFDKDFLEPLKVSQLAQKRRKIP